MSELQRYDAFYDCGLVRPIKSSNGEYVRYVDAAPLIFVPGVMACSKCKFQVSSVPVCVHRAVGDTSIAPCPNGCGELHPVTWQEYAEQNGVAAERFFNELQEAKAMITRQ